MLVGWAYKIVDPSPEESLHRSAKVERHSLSSESPDTCSGGTSCSIIAARSCTPWGNYWKNAFEISRIIRHNLGPARPSRT